MLVIVWIGLIVWAVYAYAQHRERQRRQLARLAELERLLREAAGHLNEALRLALEEELARARESVPPRA